jgi:hypothetical protein
MPIRQEVPRNEFADSYLNQRRHELRRQQRRRRRCFKDRAQARRDWEARRNGSSGGASECWRLRLDPQTGEIISESEVEISERSNAALKTQRSCHHEFHVICKPHVP